MGLLPAVPARAPFYSLPFGLRFSAWGISALVLAVFLCDFQSLCVSPSSLWSSSPFLGILHLRWLFSLTLLLFSLRWEFSLAIPLSSGCCFPAFLLVFFRILVTACFGFFLVPWAAFPPFVTVSLRACWGVLRSGFGSFSAGSDLLCCCGFRLSLFCLVRISGSRRDMVSLWDESGKLRPLFSRFVWLAFAVFLSVCLHSVPLPCSQLAFSVCCVHPMGSVGFFLVLGLLRCWFFPGPFLVPIRAGSFHPSSSTPWLLWSLIPFASEPPVMPGSWFFQIFLVFIFLRFHPFPSSLVGLVPLFLLPAVVSFLLRSFWAVSIFSFFSTLLWVLCPLFSSSGSSLGLLCPALGSDWCLTLDFANFVLPCGYPPGCFFGSFPPLPVLVSEFSPIAWSPSMVCFCFLLLFLCRFPAVVAVVFPSGLFSSFLVSVLGAFDPSLRLLSFYVACALPLFLIVLLFFCLVCMLFCVSSGSFSSSFSSYHPSLCSGFLFASFSSLSGSSVSSVLFLCFSCFLVLVPQLVFLGFRVSPLLELLL